MSHSQQRGRTPANSSNNELSPRSSAPSPSQRLNAPRPQLVRNASDTAVSTASIMTLSKIYEQQKQQRKRSQSPQPARKSPPLKALASLAPSSSKKLHKRVLSSTSVNDYFSAASSESEARSPGAQQTSPGPRLPTFQRIEPNLGTPSPQHESQPYLQERPGLTKQNLSQSKIYDRRMQQAEDDNARVIQDDIFTGADITDEVLDDEEADTKYKEKLNKMKEDKIQSDTESADVDIHSDDDTSPKTSPDNSREGTESSHVHGDASSSASSEDEKKFKFKNLFRRATLTNTESHQNDNESNMSETKKRNFLKRMALGEEDEFDNIPEDNFFAKFVNMSGGGMIPGGSKLTKEKQGDEEAQNIGPDDIPLQTLDPELEAAKILDAHRNHYAASTASSSKTRVDGEDPHRHTSDSFLAPNPDMYFRDEDSLFEPNVDAGDEHYVPPPERVRGGVLSSLLRLYENPLEASRSRLKLDEGISPVGSNVTTPIKEEENPYEAKTFGKKLKNLASGVGKKRVTIDDAASEDDRFLSPDHAKKFGSSTNLPSFGKPTRQNPIKNAGALLKSKREQAKAKITVHIADVLQRQRFVLRMARALMLFGAPTHRLEEYLRMTARVLEIDGQFIYMPGVMIISFGDPTTRTSEVQIVRCAQGLDLYRLHRVHRIYKQVVHDIVGVEDASKNLDDLLSSPPTFSPWICVLIYGIGSMFVTPWAYGGGWMNLPITFGIGLVVGFLQFIVSPKSNLYSNVFEVAASIIVSFIARALGSINGANICFAAAVQGCIALILPGWFILCGSLELQSRNLVSGSVRMFYAVIYSLMLGFGITLGAALYGWIDSNATNETTCTETLSDWWRFLFVPGFTISLALINQARLFQLPVMLVISCSGHVVSFFAAKHFYNSTQFTSAIACFVIGVLGNLYSRIFKGIAVSAMLPAVFVQIPGGMALKDALLSGIESANQIVSNTTTSSTEQALSGMAVGINLIQVCIGITVGLFASAIVVYPFGKRSTTVFTL